MTKKYFVGLFVILSANLTIAQNNLKTGKFFTAKADSESSIYFKIDTIRNVSFLETIYHIYNSNSQYKKELLRITVNNDINSYGIEVTIEKINSKKAKKNSATQPKPIKKNFRWNEVGASVLVNGVDTVPYTNADSNYYFLGFFTNLSKDEGFLYINEICDNFSDIRYYYELSKIPDKIVKLNKDQIQYFRAHGSVERSERTGMEIERKKDSAKRQDSIIRTGHIRDTMEYENFRISRDTVIHDPLPYTRNRMVYQIEKELKGFCVQSTHFKFPFKFTGNLQFIIDSSGKVTTQKLSVSSDPQYQRIVPILSKGLNTFPIIPDTIKFPGNNSIHPKDLCVSSVLKFSILNFSGDSSVVKFTKQKNIITYKSGIHKNDKLLTDTIVNRLKDIDGNFFIHIRYYNLHDEINDQNINDQNIYNISDIKNISLNKYGLLAVDFGSGANLSKNAYYPFVNLSFKYKFGGFIGIGFAPIAKNDSTGSYSSFSTTINFYQGGLIFRISAPLYVNVGAVYAPNNTISTIGATGGLSFAFKWFQLEAGYNSICSGPYASLGFNIPTHVNHILK